LKAQLAAEQVPIERFEMADVKDEAVPFGDWPFIEGVWGEKGEYTIGLAARFPET